MLKPYVSMITLGVRDMDAAVAFYERGLGFPRMDSPPEVAFWYPVPASYRPGASGASGTGHTSSSSSSPRNAAAMRPVSRR